MTEGGLGWRDVAPETLWRLLELAFNIAPKLDLDGTASQASDGAHHPVSLLAWLFGALLQRRIQAGMAPAYRTQERLQSTVRGRPLVANSMRHGELSRGRMYCRFDELTVDRPRNRQFKRVATLLAAQTPVGSLSHDRLLWCRHHMASVADVPADLHALNRDVVARHEQEDLPLVALATLVLQFWAGTTAPDRLVLPDLDPDKALMREVFERAVSQLCGRLFSDWTLRAQWPRPWQAQGESLQVVPVMRPDIVLERQDGRRTVVVETKFTAHLTREGNHPYGERKLKSAHLYQLFAYVRSQPWSGQVEGVLVYPRCDDDGPNDVRIDVDDVTLRVVTLDLRTADRWQEVEATLRRAVTGGLDGTLSAVMAAAG